MRCIHKKLKKRIDVFMIALSFLTAAILSGQISYATEVVSGGTAKSTVGEVTAEVAVAQTSAEDFPETGQDVILALAYLEDEIPVFLEASQYSQVTELLTCGQTVFLKDAVYNENEGRLFVQVDFWQGDKLLSGYVDRARLACSDQRFLNWERAFLASLGEKDAMLFQEPVIYDNGVTNDVAKFPESYQEGLMALKNAHPDWVFVPLNTGLDWNTVITNELKGDRSLVHKSFPDCAKDGPYDDGNWFYATREILEYYMDPRNGFTENRIFQFELLTYNETYHTESAVESFLNQTFMKSSKPAPGPGTEKMTFAHIFWLVGKADDRRVSPFHLAARVYQEQGQGTSALISGTYPGFVGYYNYFNVKASGTSQTQIIVNGLTYAKQKGWDSAYKSIMGGAGTIALNYIQKGQDTLYLQKFNVNPNAANSLYNHQYMQNISAPTTEAGSIRKLYSSANALDNSFVFRIPVFKNMPEAACPYPSDKNKLVLKLPSGYNTTIWVDGVPYASQSKDGNRVVQLADDKAQTAVAYRYNASGVPNGMQVWLLSGNNGVYTIEQQPDLQDLFRYRGFSMRIQGEVEMRMKTEISMPLKQYGTLIAKKSEIRSGALLTGSPGVVKQVHSDGDVIFTGNLKNLSSSDYKTLYVFRSYGILEKNGKEYTLYGPMVSRSIVDLTNQILKAKVYEAGSDEDVYLRQILTDAGVNGK